MFSLRQRLEAWRARRLYDVFEKDCDSAWHEKYDVFFTKGWICHLQKNQQFTLLSHVPPSINPALLLSAITMMSEMHTSDIDKERIRRITENLLYEQVRDHPNRKALKWRMLFIYDIHCTSIFLSSQMENDLFEFVTPWIIAMHDWLKARRLLHLMLNRTRTEPACTAQLEPSINKLTDALRKAHMLYPTRTQKKIVPLVRTEAQTAQLF